MLPSSLDQMKAILHPLKNRFVPMPILSLERKFAGAPAFHRPTSLVSALILVELSERSVSRRKRFLLGPTPPVLTEYCAIAAREDNFPLPPTLRV